MERMELDAIQISADGHFEFWFNDGEMFWGHSIHVNRLSGDRTGAGADGRLRDTPPGPRGQGKESVFPWTEMNTI